MNAAAPYLRREFSEVPPWVDMCGLIRPLMAAADLAAGAKPILVTSLTRRIFGPDGKIRSTLVPYVEAMKSLAAEKKVQLVDLHARSVELVERLGPEKAKTLGPPHPNDATKVDGTHLNADGAKATAPLIVDELKKAETALAKYFVEPRE